MQQGNKKGNVFHNQPGLPCEKTKTIASTNIKEKFFTNFPRGEDKKNVHKRKNKVYRQNKMPSTSPLTQFLRRKDKQDVHEKKNNGPINKTECLLLHYHASFPGQKTKRA